jgi:hypothetical protein
MPAPAMAMSKVGEDSGIERVSITVEVDFARRNGRSVSCDTRGGEERAHFAIRNGLSRERLLFERKV